MEFRASLDVLSPGAPPVILGEEARWREGAFMKLRRRSASFSELPVAPAAREAASKRAAVLVQEERARRQPPAHQTLPDGADVLRPVAGEAWRSVLDVLGARVDPAHRAHVATTAASLGRPDWPLAAWAQLFEFLGMRADDASLTRIDDVRPFIDRGIPAGMLEHIMPGLDGIPAGQRRRACETLAPVILGMCGQPNYDWPALMAVAGAMEPDDGARAVQLGLRLQYADPDNAGGGWRSEDWARVLSVAAGVRPEDEERFVETLSRLYEPGMDPWIRACLVRAVGSRPPQEWRPMVACVEQMLESFAGSPDVFRYGVLDLTRALEDEPSGRWPDFTQALCTFLRSRPVHGSSERAISEAVRALRAVEPGERANVAQHVATLPLSKAFSYAWPDLVSVMARFPEPSRPAGAACLRALFERVADEQATLDLVNAVLQVPELAQRLHTYRGGADLDALGCDIARLLLPATAPRPLPLGLGVAQARVVPDFPPPWNALHLAAFWPIREALLDHIDTCYSEAQASIDAGAFDPNDPTHRRSGFFYWLRGESPAVLMAASKDLRGLSGEAWERTCKKDESLLEAKSWWAFSPTGVLLATLKYARHAPDTLHAIAERCVDVGAEDPWHAARVMPLFDSLDPARRHAIAWRAQQTWSGFAYHVDRFGLDDHEERRALAYACVERAPDDVLRNLLKFRLRDCEERLRLATVCAEKVGEGILCYLEGLDLDEAWEHAYLAKTVLRDPDALSLIPQKRYAPYRHLASRVAALVSDQALTPASATQLINDLLRKAGQDPGKWSWVREVLNGRADAWVLRETTLMLAATIFHLNYVSRPSQLAWANSNDLLGRAFLMRAPFLRAPMVSLIGSLASHKASRKAFARQARLRLVDRRPEAIFLQAFVRHAATLGVDTRAFEEGLDTTLYRKLRDRFRLRTLLAAAEKVLHTEALEPADKTRILDVVGKAANDTAGYEAIEALRLLTELGRFDVLKDVETDLKSLADKVLGEHLASVQVDDAAKKYSETFGRSRMPFAVWIYAAKMRQLDDPRAAQAVSWYITDVLTGDYKKHREEGLDNPHIQRLNRAHPLAMEYWHQNVTMPALPPQTLSLHTVPWLRMKIFTDGHLSPSLLRAMPEVQRALHPDSSEAERDDAYARASSLAAAAPGDAAAALQLALIELSRAPDELQAPRLVAVMQALKAIGSIEELANDIAGAVRATGQAPRLQAHEVEGRDTDDPFDCLLAGTEVAGSCQRLDGSPELNQGLLGYLLNGQTRLLEVVEKSTGRIITRAEYRCLQDDHGRPVLYLERIYGDPSYTNTIVRMAINKGRRMNVSVTVAKGTYPDAKAFGRCIRSTGGRAPSEYCDARGGVQADSIFDIPESDILWEPVRTGIDTSTADGAIDPRGVRVRRRNSF
jgi:hypothetical protein